MSDEGGVGIHRFQAVVLNLVFGFGYVTAFLHNTSPGVRTFPFLEFEQWQLTLLGISAAGYLGFKSNENSTSTKLERQIETVRKTEAEAPARTTVKRDAAGDILESVAKPTGNSAAYEEMKNKLSDMGMLNTTTEQPSVRDINKF
jgi:hypothetical protein